MNTMHKRLLVLLLVCALTLGVIPALTLPIFAVDTQKNVYQAAHAESVALDGNLDEAFLTNGKMSEEVPFGVLWNRDTLYLAVEPREGDSSLEITLGEKKLTVTKSGVTGVEGAKSAWGKVIEVSIPNTVTEYGQSTALALSMGGASWAGQVTYTSVVRVMNAQAEGLDVWKVNNKTIWGGSDEDILSNGYHFDNYTAQGEPVNPCDYLEIPNKIGRYNSKNYEIGGNDMEFKDEKSISKWAKDAVRKVSDAGIMIGDDLGNFNPKKNITREEVAVIIAKLLEK